MSDSTLSKDAIVIERTFDAPVDLIWQLWTQPDHFQNWYGPKGFSVPVANMDVRVGGKRLLCMESQDGSTKMWLAGEYTEIVPNVRLVYTESMADEHGNVVLPSAYGANDEDYPAMTTVTVQLEDLGGRTKMVMRHAGVGVNEPGAAEGWEQSIDKLTARLETVLNDQ